MDLLLQTIRKYIPLSAADEEIALQLFHTRHFKKGAHLLVAGQVCRYVTFIEQGLVRYYINKGEEEQTNYFNKEGEFVCYYVSFLPQTPGHVNIQALEDTTVQVISFADIELFYKTVQHGERFGRLAIEQVFVSVIEQLASMYTDSPVERYRKFIAAYPDIGQRIPQYYVASYVGVKPESLSRIRRRIAEGH